jgi:hypothetical protein
MKPFILPNEEPQALHNCLGLNIDPCSACKKHADIGLCSINMYKKLFFLYGKTDMQYIVRKHINDIIYIRAAISAYYPDFTNEIEKYCALV